LEKQFVCVRIIKANGLDMNLFQFDYDQTWSVMFLNADRTIYGRYGTRASGRKDADTHISVAGFKKALRRALATHKGYPNNKRLLASFTGPKADFVVPERIPTMETKNCIHCHQVHDSLLRHKWEQRKITAADYFVYPLPEQIGMKMEPDDCLQVKLVTDGSPAAKAGLSADDRIVRINGIPLLSQADIQWLLHRSPANTRLAVEYQRGEVTAEATVTLTGDWKLADLSWRESSWRALRHAVRFVPLTADQKRQQKIAAGAMAFEIKNMFGPRPEPLRRAGVKIGDIVVGIADRTDLTTETDFLVHLRLKYGPGDRIPLRILRSGRKITINAPTW